MSYNTYWSGSLAVQPPLTPREVIKLEQWLGHNDETRNIKDPEVLTHLQAEGWGIYTPWSPVDRFFDEQDRYPGFTYLEMESEGSYPGIMGIILFQLLKQIKGHAINGEMSWDGDESDDIGEIKVIDGKIHVCQGSIVYEEPSEENLIKEPSP